MLMLNSNVCGPQMINVLWSGMRGEFSGKVGRMATKFGVDINVSLRMTYSGDSLSFHLASPDQHFIYPKTM